MMKKYLLIILILTLLAANLAAASFIEFETTLSHSKNGLLRGEKSVVFSLYKGTETSPAVWSETQTVTFIDGKLSVQLGNAAENQLLPSYLESDSVWIGIQVDNEEVKLPLSYVPFAIKAKSADIANSIDWTNVQNKPSITSPLQVRNNTITLIDGTEANQVLKWTGSTWEVSTLSDITQGQKGDKGDTGTTGATAPQGLQGDQGIQGLQGLKGDTGERGLQGIPGTTAEKGDKGDKGDTGAQGSTGTNGTNGIAGATGPKGDQGLKGDTGLTGTTGAKGDAGAQGVKGDTGSTGAKGDTGTAGTNGTNGLNGADGATGVKGDIGSTGAKGDQGIQGLIGNTGANGTNGTNGATWLSGNTTPNNNDGTNGDFYLDTVTHKVYKKAAGAWAETTDLWGTTDATPLIFKANNLNALKIIPATDVSQAPNIIMGFGNNSITGLRGSTIGGGGSNNNLNSITGEYATISGGKKNVSFDFGAISGGVSNNVRASYGSIGGGRSNSIIGDYGTVPGGDSNIANSYAFSAGQNAEAPHTNAFVWSDGSAKTISPTTKTFTARADNGFVLTADSAQTYDPTKTVYIDAEGRLGIGMIPNATHALSVNGTAANTAGGVWATLSDRRLKKSIKPIENPLDTLLKLNGVTYEWKDPKAHGNLTGPQMGFIAQEVEEVLPQWVLNDGEHKMIQTIGIDALIIESIKALQQENKQLKDRIEALEKSNNSR